MPSRRFKQVDVFTEKPFFGNPVAVVIDAAGLEGAEMQRIAAWTNLSETTFVLPTASANADYQLRIFSPNQELPFAGHPTLGSAHAVIESGFATAHDGRLRQECLAGLIDITIEETTSGKRIFLEAPDAKISVVDDNDARSMQTGLGLMQPFTHPPARVDVGVVWLVAELADSKAVAALEPEMNSLSKLSAATNAAGITVFGKSDDEFSRLHVRSFAPALGVAEDPVCGSGNASVGAYLVYTGLVRSYGTEFIARQGMQVGRDGQVSVRIDQHGVRIGATQSPASTGPCELNNSTSIARKRYVAARQVNRSVSPGLRSRVWIQVYHSGGEPWRSDGIEAHNSMSSMVLVRGWQVFREFAAAPEIAGRYKPLANCLRSGGLVA